MCGIVGYVGEKQALEVVVEGLRKLGVGLNVLLNNAGRSGCIPYTTS